MTVPDNNTGLGDGPGLTDNATGFAGYDAVLVVSFGGPEGPDEVMPFLENVTAGRGVPRERLELVAQHYLHRGGVSPINGQNRRLVADLEAELAEQGIALPVYWGNRNWDPFLEDAIRQMRDDGVEKAIAYVTSAFSSYSGCRQYRENIAAARKAVGPDAPVVDKLRVFYDHPLFIEMMRDNVISALENEGASLDMTRLVFTAHSIPTSMAQTSDYVAQLQEAAALVADGVKGDVGEVLWDLVYQSRSGPPQMPWLEPDVVDHINAVGDGDDIEAIGVVPLGFMSDHMEVLQDLDTDAKAAAEQHGCAFWRASTAGADPRVPKMIIELIAERAGGERRALGPLEIKPDHCAENCCPAPRRRPRPS